MVVSQCVEGWNRIKKKQRKGKFSFVAGKFNFSCP
jgi:hypothetical protein